MNAAIPEAVVNEMRLWFLATDHSQLAKMWEQRISAETYGLTDEQSKAVAIVQAAAYAIAMQAVTVHTMREMAAMVRLYVDIKHSQ